MFRSRTLACSFCGKDAAHVARLVAGPRVYICDSCVAEAARIMNMPGSEGAPQARRRSLHSRAADRLRKFLGRMQLSPL